MTKQRAFWLCSYPRSGNMLIRAILWNCFGLKSGAEYVEHSTILSSWELCRLMGACERVPKHQKWAPIKTHALPPAGQRTLFIVRDGRDATMSYWRMLVQLAGETLTMRDFIEGKTMFGSWGTWMRQADPKNRPDARWVRYEDVKEDVPGTVRYLAGMLGMDPKTYEIPSIDEMRAALRRKRYVNQGRSGGWRQEWTAEEIRLFDDLHGDMLEAYGYERAKRHAGSHATATA